MDIDFGIVLLEYLLQFMGSVSEYIYHIVDAVSTFFLIIHISAYCADYSYESVYNIVTSLSKQIKKT